MWRVRAHRCPAREPPTAVRASLQ
uniref:Uncharacterized protein n=1 Tax=Arundo donax TaxID=35708 RepID=A0A0A9HA89_ARUDO